MCSQNPICPWSTSWRGPAQSGPSPRASCLLSGSVWTSLGLGVWECRRFSTHDAPWSVSPTSPLVFSVTSQLTTGMQWFIKEGVSFMQSEGHVLKCQLELVMGPFPETASFMLSLWSHWDCKSPKQKPDSGRKCCDGSVACLLQWYWTGGPKRGLVCVSLPPFQPLRYCGLWWYNTNTYTPANVQKTTLQFLRKWSWTTRCGWMWGGTFLKSCPEIFEAQHFPAWGECVCVSKKKKTNSSWGWVWQPLRKAESCSLVVVVLWFHFHWPLKFNVIQYFIFLTQEVGKYWYQIDVQIMLICVYSQPFQRVHHPQTLRKRIPKWFSNNTKGKGGGKWIC